MGANFFPWKILAAFCLITTVTKLRRQQCHPRRQKAFSSSLQILCNHSHNAHSQIAALGHRGASGPDDPAQRVGGDEAGWVGTTACDLATQSHTWIQILKWWLTCLDHSPTLSKGRGLHAYGYTFEVKGFVQRPPVPLGDVAACASWSYFHACDGNALARVFRDFKTFWHPRMVSLLSAGGEPESSFVRYHDVGRSHIIDPFAHYRPLPHHEVPFGV